MCQEKEDIKGKREPPLRNIAYTNVICHVVIAYGSQKCTVTVKMDK